MRAIFLRTPDEGSSSRWLALMLRNLVGGLAKRWSRRLARRNEQEEIDTLKVCLLAHIHHHQQQSAGAWDHHALFTEIEALDFDEQLTRSARLLGAQLEHAFEQIDRHAPRQQAATGEQHAPTEAAAWVDRRVAEQRSPEAAAAVAAEAAAEAKFAAAAAAAAAAVTAAATEDALLGALGFAPQCRASSASADAGDGVFVRGAAAAGSVVALYPGDVYAPEQLDDKTVEQLFAGGNDFVIGRYDRTFIDGASVGAAPNPLGVGHLINHPPPGTEPNVVQFAFDFSSDDAKAGRGAPPPLPAHLRYLIPNQFATSTNSIKHLLVERARRPAVLVPSLVLVTTRAVQDEELFLNYRLNPKLPAPEWYTSVDPEEDRRRWP